MRFVPLYPVRENGNDDNPVIPWLIAKFTSKAFVVPEAPVEKLLSTDCQFTDMQG